MWVQARGSSREKERLCARHTVMRSTTPEWRGILLSSSLYCAGTSVNEATVLSHISAELRARSLMALEVIMLIALDGELFDVATLVFRGQRAWRRGVFWWRCLSA